MPSLTDHSSLTYVKGLYLGRPGSGKTGSLDALVGAGYKLFIFDFDNLLGSLVQYVKRNNPDKISNVKFQTFTDKMKALSIPVAMVGNDLKVMSMADGTPKAFTNALLALSSKPGWNTPEDGDLGDPGKFGRDSVVVIDSLTNLAECAFRYVQAMNPMAKDGRQYFGAAQKLVMEVITILFSAQFETNVLVLAHLDFRENELEIVKGFPRTIGGALQDKPNSYFNCVLMAESTGSGTNIKRVIRTNSTGVVDLKNPVSFKIADQLPLESGLATFFEAVTGYVPGK